MESWRASTSSRGAVQCREDVFDQLDPMTQALPLAQTPNGQIHRGHAAAMSHDMLGYLETAAAQGDFLKIPLPLTPAYFINHPDLIEAVMVKQSRSFHKPFTLKYTANQIFGDNLFTSDGELWRVLRSMLQPGFSVERLQNHGKTMVDFTSQLLDTWQAGDTVEMTTALMELTLQTTTHSFFGIDLSQYSSTHVSYTSSGQDLIRFIEVFFKRISSFPLPAWVPVPTNRELKRLIQRRNDFFFPIIEQRRASGEDRGDVLSMLIKAQAADTTGYITDLQVCNEVSNLFAAGYEVTAYSLVFTLYLISQHPEVEAKVMEEVDRVVGQRQITVDDLDDLPYLERVLKESMRLFPVTALVSRQAIAPVTLQGQDLPKNSLILIAPWTLHRRPDLYPNPLQFDPERFAPSQQGDRPKMAYLPFSGGPRACIGQGFAMMQMRINLAMLLQRYHFSPIPGYEFEPAFNFNTRPKNGLPMTLTAR